MASFKPLHLMHLPYDTNGGHALAFWAEEMARLKSFLEEQTGRNIEVSELNRQIRLQNEVRRLLWRISRCSAAERVPLSGLDVMTVMETKSSCFDLEAYATLLRQLIAELEIGPRPESPSSSRAPLASCSPAARSARERIRSCSSSRSVAV